MSQTASVQGVRPDVLRLCAAWLAWFAGAILVGAASKGLVLFGREGASLAGHSGLWTTILVVVGYCAATPRKAFVRAAVAVPGLLVGFYSAFQLIEGGFPQRYALIWSVVCIAVCPIFSVFGALARRADWLGSVAAGLIAGSLVEEILDTGVLSPAAPVSAYEAAHRHYGAIVVSTFDVLAAIAIVLWMCPSARRRLWAIPVAIASGTALRLVLSALAPYVLGP